MVDFNGRVLAQAGDGEKIMVSDIDIDALRHERRIRLGHQPLAHLRTELYSLYRDGIYPKGSTDSGELSIEGNEKLFKDAKKKVGYGVDA